MIYAEFAQTFEGAERAWLEALAAYATEIGRPLDLVLADALIDQHRALQQAHEAIEFNRATIARLAAESRELRRAAA
jgi:hypothetical protein